MSQAADQDGSAADVEREVLRFVLSDTHYALPVSVVDNIIETKPTTRVPRAADAIGGVIDHRGESAVIIDLRGLFNLPKTDTPELQKRFIILNDDIDNQTVGLRADAVIGVETLDLAQFKEDLTDVEAQTSIGEQYTLLDGVFVRDEESTHQVIELLDAETVVERVREASRPEFRDE